MAFDPNTVDGSEILHHLGCLKPYKCSNEKSYQPQLVSRISSTNSIAEVEGDSTKLRYLSHQRGATNRTAGFIFMDCTWSEKNPLRKTNITVEDSNHQ